jgi:transcriptional regulator with XRE-family HTH domain
MARSLQGVHSQAVKAFEGLEAALRELRNRRELTQAELSQRAGIGATQVSRYETGSEKPSITSLSAVLDALGFEVHDLAHALDQVNGRGPKSRIGTPRQQWVAVLAARGLDRDALWGLAFGALQRDDPAAGDDFVASVEAAAAELARDAWREATESHHAAALVAEPPNDYGTPRPKKRR